MSRPLPGKEYIYAKFEDEDQIYQLSVAAAAKIKEFYDKGGVVIATSKLPTKSAEFGRDKEIQKMVGDVFGLPVDDPPTADLQRAMGGRLVSFYFSKRNAAGGRAYFLPKAEPWVLQWP